MGRKDTTIEDIKQKNLIAEYEACIYLDCSPAHLKRMRVNDASFAACWKSGRKISRPALDNWLTMPGNVEIPEMDFVDASELAAEFEDKLKV